MQPDAFHRRVLAWFDQHGRKDLPWQHNATPYRVWVSEVMLQQTQVAAVIPYYERFMARFPDLPSLAAAELDEVLKLWAGLGYYARARHLHQTACLVCARHSGALPLDIRQLQSLPGIGRSTAGAILALAAGQPQPVLDGNIKRLLARFAAVAGWPGQSRVLATLWGLAERYTPDQRAADYTQAMMDLGALVCTPRRPDCQRCPLADGCIAHQTAQELAYPAPKPGRELPIRTTRMLLLRDGQGRILLERRPPTGIWGGLWSLPECPLAADIAAWCREQWGFEVEIGTPQPVVRHIFSHFRLDMTPTPARVRGAAIRVMEGARFVWYNPHDSGSLGMAAPVRRLLTALMDKG